MSIFDKIVFLIMLVSIFIVIYHHIIYPFLIKKRYYIKHFHKPKFIKKDKFYSNGLDLNANKNMIKKSISEYDSEKMAITIIMPAYNESLYIADKIRNLSQLEYPLELLTVYIVCDGCSDKTVDVVNCVLREPECRHLQCVVFDFPVNQGKLNVINRVVKYVTTPLVALTDVSALLAQDILLITSEYFNNQSVGVVSGGYTLLNKNNTGESTYWRYQNGIKESESLCGSVMGCHGAFYILRTRLYKILPRNIINDDFVLPMSILKSGDRVIYASEALAIEIEVSSSKDDYNRRIRISAGNLQQAFFLREFLTPKYGLIAVNFFSGKFLRAFIPIFLLLSLFSSGYLSRVNELFFVIFIIQILIYVIVLFMHIFKVYSKFKIVRVVDYFVIGHWASVLGAYALLTGQYQARSK